MTKKKRNKNCFSELKKCFVKIRNYKPKIKSSIIFDLGFIFISVLTFIIAFNYEYYVKGLIESGSKNPETFFYGTLIVFIALILYSLYLVLYSININFLKKYLTNKGYKLYIEKEHDVHSNIPIFGGVEFIALIIVSFMSYINSQGAMQLSLDLHNSMINGVVNIEKTNNIMLEYGTNIGTYATLFIIFIVFHKILQFIKTRYIEELFIDEYKRKNRKKKS